MFGGTKVDKLVRRRLKGQSADLTNLSPLQGGTPDNALSMNLRLKKPIESWTCLPPTPRSPTKNSEACYTQHNALEPSPTLPDHGNPYYDDLLPAYVHSPGQRSTIGNYQS